MALPDSTAHPFDVEAFLARPLVARVATAASDGAPTVRPVWFLWEEEALWWITGSYSVVGRHLAADARASVVVDTCDLHTLEFLQVLMHGRAQVVPYDQDRARRKLRRYLGQDEAAWPTDFTGFGADARLVRFTPHRTVVRDLSKTRP